MCVTGGGDGGMGFDHIPLHKTGLSYDRNGISDKHRNDGLFINDAGTTSYSYGKKTEISPYAIRKNKSDELRT